MSKIINKKNIMVIIYLEKNKRNVLLKNIWYKQNQVKNR